MWSWITEHSGALTVLVNVVMACIWLAYLQIFLVSFQRSNRAVVHIGMADEGEGDARCIVSNMGSDTVYIIAVLVEVSCGDTTYDAIVTDRTERDRSEAGDFRERTNQGPLGGGEAVDIGDFRSIAERASRSRNIDLNLESCDSLTITVAMAAQQAQKLHGGFKRFDIARDEDGDLRFSSPDLLTRQIKKRKHRKQLYARITGTGARGAEER
ncbi:MAG: hypothetical protein RKE49_14945 [Oceanicaulis sp.]